MIRKYACSAFLLALTLHWLWANSFIFCLLAPEEMNSIVFGRDSEDFCSLPPSGANKQKIKRRDHRKCNVGASKNAEQAFSTQRYLYSCDGLLFLFSSLSPHKLIFNLF